MAKVSVRGGEKGSSSTSRRVRSLNDLAKVIIIIIINNNSLSLLLF